MSFRVVRLAAKSFRKEKYAAKPSSDNTWEIARKKRLKLDNYECTECGGKVGVQVHHIVPVSRGGSHAMSNLKTLCPKHHQKEHRHQIKRKY